MMRRAVVVAFCAGALLLGAFAWVGYGNPFRGIPSGSIASDNDFRGAFFVGTCGRKGDCSIDPKHRRVLHFSFGDGIMSPTGNITGKGKNPIAMAHGLGLKFLPEPDYESAAVKWCTTGKIYRMSSSHVYSYIIPLPRDPLATARCVQNQLPRRFSAHIGDPLGIVREYEPFNSIRDAVPYWMRR
jgi:hypothetical protein